MRSSRRSVESYSVLVLSISGLARSCSSWIIKINLISIALV